MTIQYTQTGSTADRIKEYLPKIFWDSAVLADIIEAVRPETENIIEFLQTPDENSIFPNTDVRAEIDSLLANEIGWGFERLLYQFFILTTNHKFDEFRELYDVQSDFPNHRQLRDRLLFMAKPNDLNTISVLKEEVSLVGRLDTVAEDFANYTVEIVVVAEDASFEAVVQERLVRTLPAHLGLTFVLTGAIIDDDPPNRLSDGTPVELF